MEAQEIKELEIEKEIEIAKKRNEELEKEIEDLKKRLPQAKSINLSKRQLVGKVAYDIFNDTENVKKEVRYSRVLKECKKNGYSNSHEIWFILHILEDLTLTINPEFSSAIDMEIKERNSFNL